ncbi:SpoIID/LytB domain-containing protein [Terriglobus albidus]|uniref:SpoIID/LytB domain-containing protein n=1 Tax=Terriglobus albidus TaxID=1592106 RepID=UPI0021E0987B|nr:SpoIID/LytB domain-containing protein [Terriglobus albidus]
MKAVWLLTFLPALAMAQSDGGGRDVTIAMFSTHAVHAVTLAATGEGAWTATCAACAHRPLATPMRFAKGEIFAGGPVRVTDDASKETRTATGIWHLRATAEGMDIVLSLPSERYVAAVVSAEGSPSEKPQALEALAIVARTYALNGRHWKPRAGHLPAELCDSTQCQAMRLGHISTSIETAVRSSTGETMWFRGRRAEVFFSQHCGGETEAASAVWPTLRTAKYLAAHPDIFCVRRDKAAWHTEVPTAQLMEIAHAEGWKLPSQLADLRVTQRSPSHRVLKLDLIGEDGARFPVAASSLRLAIGRALGWNRVRSDLYDVAVRNDLVVFDGHGHGHGVGLCQAGASEMAVQGKSAREIVEYYFTGVSVGITPNDAGWQQSSNGPLRIRSVGNDAVYGATIQHAWAEATKRFPVQKALTPEIVAAPSVEIFRQMTASPGWLLAATRGNTVVLQPWSILRNQADNVLLHEFLHLCIESEAGAKAPLWLREGLVEYLAGDAQSGETMQAASLETALRSPSTQHESQQAHAAAAAKVRALVGRYGITSVRAWLGSGVPSGIA